MKFNLLIVIILAILLLPAGLQAESTFSGDRLEKACIDYVNKLLGEQCEVSVVKQIGDQVFQKDGITAKCHAEPKNLRGLSYVGLEFRQGDKIVKMLRVPVRVKILGKAVVAARSLSNGTTLGKSDLKIKLVDVTGYNPDELSSMRYLIDKDLRHNVPLGTVITHKMVRGEAVVHRGDKVTVMVQAGGVRIRTSGYAIKDAAVGEDVKIKRDGKILQGTVAEDGTVILARN